MKIENLSLSKQQRLNQAEDFKRIFNTGKKHSNRYFAVFTSPNNLPYARLGLVVAKKVVKTAVKRNQFKRIIRESFRLNQKILIGLDMIVVIYQQTNQLDKIQLREKLDQAWLRLISH